MRLDHIAYRVARGKRDEAAKFFIDAFGYKQQGNPFEIYFDDEHKEKAMCVALEPPEKTVVWSWDDVKEKLNIFDILWAHKFYGIEYHMSPEVFISEGSPGSIVDEWVKSRGGVGGIHHLAYQTNDVAAEMKRFQDNGWLEFSSEVPLTCPGITQVFSKPNVLGVVIEFINRTGDVGFCKENVKNLMLASRGD